MLERGKIGNISKQIEVVSGLGHFVRLICISLLFVKGTPELYSGLFFVRDVQVKGLGFACDMHCMEIDVPRFGHL